MAELVQGDQLVLGEETRTWDLHLNADELDPSQPVLIGELPLGGHILELSTPDDAETMRLQLHFGVVPPIDLLPAKPLVSCQLSEERNGDDVPFGLRNQSASEHTVRLDAQGPPGWMAMLQGDRIRSLSPGAEDVVMLRIERMNPLATETDPLPFNVTATPLNGTDPPRTATVYVEAS
jgi:hypothetical protein